jgi:uncharacterized membrane protein
VSITEGLLPAQLLWTGTAFYLLALAVAVWRAPWRRLLEHSELQHVFLGAAVSIALLWSVRAGISPGLGIHFIGMTLLTLMFGWQLALVVSGLALTMVCVLGLDVWEGFGINGLVVGVIPVAVSFGIYRLVERYLPNHLFIYIFVTAFFGAMVAVAMSAVVMVLLLTGSELYSYSKISYEYLAYLPLIMFPEGVLNGMLATIFVVFKPLWMSTFDDAKYLRNK